MIDQNAPHRLRRCSVEIVVILNLAIFKSRHEPQIGFMHQFRSLQRMVWPFRVHPYLRYQPQLLVNCRDQLITRRGLALGDLAEQAGNVVRVIGC